MGQTLCVKQTKDNKNLQKIMEQIPSSPFVTLPQISSIDEQPSETPQGENYQEFIMIPFLEELFKKILQQQQEDMQSDQFLQNALEMLSSFIEKLKEQQKLDNSSILLWIQEENFAFSQTKNKRMLNREISNTSSIIYNLEKSQTQKQFENSFLPQEITNKKQTALINQTPQSKSTFYFVLDIQTLEIIQQVKENLEKLLIEITINWNNQQLECKTMKESFDNLRMQQTLQLFQVLKFSFTLPIDAIKINTLSYTLQVSYKLQDQKKAFPLGDIQTFVFDPFQDQKIHKQVILIKEKKQNNQVVGKLQLCLQYVNNFQTLLNDWKNETMAWIELINQIQANSGGGGDKKSKNERISTWSGQPSFQSASSLYYKNNDFSQF